MFQTFDYIYNLLRFERVYISNVKSNNIHRTMLPYVINVRKNDLIVDLNFIVKAVLKVLKLLSKLKNQEGKVLFAGNDTDKFVNKMVELTAKKTKQDFFPYSSRKLNFSLLKEEIKKLDPVFIIILYPKNSLPLLKVAKDLNIPVIGFCDVNYNLEYFTYFIPTNLSYRSLYVYCNLLVKIFNTGL